MSLGELAIVLFIGLPVGLLVSLEGIRILCRALGLMVPEPTARRRRGTPRMRMVPNAAHGDSAMLAGPVLPDPYESVFASADTVGGLEAASPLAPRPEVVVPPADAGPVVFRAPRDRGPETMDLHPDPDLDVSDAEATLPLPAAPSSSSRRI